MRFIRKFFSTIIIIAVIGLIAAYWISRTDFATKRFAANIESKTGFQTTVGSSSLTWKGVAVLKDVRIVVPNDVGSEVTLHALIAPTIEWKFIGCKKSLRLIRPEIRLMQNKNDAWIPALLKDLHLSSLVFLPDALSAIGAKFGGKISVEGAAFYVTNNVDDILFACADANFYYKPMRLSENKTAAYGVFTTQRLAFAETEIGDFTIEWLAIDKRIIWLDDSTLRITRYPEEEIPVEIIETDEPVIGDDPWF